MKNKRYLYGMIGLLSLIGFVGVFTEERSFLLFFAFAVDFEYFFKESDEMLDAYMTTSASRAFYIGMFVTAIVASIDVLLFGETGREALVTGFAKGWAASIIIYTFSTAYYSVKEKWVARND